jgi:hypothetical protein
MLITTSATNYSNDITPLTHLRSIQFDLCGGDPVNPNQWVTQVLSHVSSVHLEDVSFQLHYSCYDLSEALEWSEVDVILQRSTFSDLRTLSFVQCVFTLTSAGPQPFAGTSIAQRLPQCAARGILRVDPS